MKCFWCGTEIESPTKNQKESFRRSGRAYCSKYCGQKYRNLVSSETMKKTNYKYASQRLKTNNPMFIAENRIKMSYTLKNKKHKPAIQGGNGKGLTKPQKMLFNELNKKYKPYVEYVISTKDKDRSCNYPNCYKIDIALPVFKIAIEVDGNSHSTRERKKQDEKKDNFLLNIGWQVIRISNQQILNNLNYCLQKINFCIAEVLNDSASLSERNN